MSDIDIDAGIVIDHLARRIAELEVELAKQAALIHQLTNLPRGPIPDQAVHADNGKAPVS